MTARRTLAVFGAAALTMGTACSGDDDSADTAPPTAATPPPTEATTTTTIATTTSSSTSTSTSQTPTTPPTTPPATVAGGDWEAIVEGLNRRAVDLYAAPDLSRIGEYCAPDTDCSARLETQLDDAIAKAQHIEGQQPFDVIEIVQALVSEPSPGGSVANVVFIIAPQSPPPARLVDAAGNVIDTLALTTTETRGKFTLISWESDPSLPWRVVLAENLGPVT